MECLKCRECGSRNTVVTKAKEANEAFKTSDFTSSISGKLSPELILEAIKTLVAAVCNVVESIFGYNEAKEKTKSEEAKANANVIICKDCGNWERI